MQRQYNSNLYERLDLSREKDEIIRLASEGNVIWRQQLLINCKSFCWNWTRDICLKFLDIENVEGQADRLLLMHIHPSVDRVISTSNGSVFLRIGDRKQELKGDDLIKKLPIRLIVVGEMRV